MKRPSTMGQIIPSPIGDKITILPNAYGSRFHPACEVLLTMRLLDLEVTDADELAALNATMGWQSSRSDWEMIFSSGVVLGHRSDGGQLCSAGALFDYGEGASIGRMLVRADLQGRGIGRELLDALLRRRREPSGWVTLVASEAGIPLYRRFGFSVGEGIHKILVNPFLRSHFAPETGAPSFVIDALSESNLEEVLRADRAAFGADRRAVVQARLRQAEAAVVVRAASGKLAGHAMAVRRPGYHAIGPVLASSRAAAFAAIAAVAKDCEDSLRFDVSEDSGLLELLLAWGATDAGRRTRMTMGQAPTSTFGHRAYAQLGQDFG